MTLNSDMPWPSVEDARSRVLDIQKKLHRWTKVDSLKRFDDLFNLVCDRAMLVVAWDRVRSNRGSRTAGVDGQTRWHIEHRHGVTRFLEETRVSLKAREYCPAPVKEHGIPKAGGKVRYLGIPTIRDRVVQMALKLVLEPIFEVDFCPTSFGYRPARRAQDAIAEIVRFINPPSSYDYVVEGDIKACFDNVHHGVLMQLVRQRIADRKVLRPLPTRLEQVERSEARRSGLMQKVLLPRYNEQRSTVITSNIPWEGWGDYLGDHLGATALVDRLLHHSHVIVINGPSYRDWEHKQDVGGARNAAASTTEAAIAPAKGTARATSGGARRRGK